MLSSETDLRKILFNCRLTNKTLKKVVAEFTKCYSPLNLEKKVTKNNFIKFTLWLKNIDFDLGIDKKQDFLFSTGNTKLETYIEKD